MLPRCQVLRLLLSFLWLNIKWFDPKKGYGFIKDNESEKDIFLHVSSLEKSKLRVLKENQEIEFEIKEEKGKLQAVNLKRI